MKTFKGQNHYEVLNVSPGADAADLKRAYRAALALYDEDALATYSLFSDRQRAQILQTIEAAYHTLVNEEQRAAYNQMLLDKRLVDASFFSIRDQKHLADPGEGESTSRRLAKWVRKKSNDAEVRERIDAVMASDTVSGADLKGIREALGVEQTEIYDIAKIRGGMLKNIEEDRFEDLPQEIFLKQFLSSYADILQIDPLHVITGYLKNMTGRP